ncbi:MAG: glutamine synthetase [bacterium]|nr:glutamine synthetase [Gammaproteobacteria bacterium]HIL98301.1 glutamine synthetase [Pseudomonadales bacterium]
MSLADDLIKQYENEGIRRIKLGVTDIDGVVRGKYISLEKFTAIAASTSGFCDCILGWDVDDQLYDNATFTGWHTAFPDALYRLDLATERRLLDEGNIPYFVGEFVADDRVSLHPICPRSRLRQVLADAHDMGFEARLAFEYEFFVFNETPQTVRDKNYTNLEPLSPGNFGYSIVRTGALSDLFNEFMDYCFDHNFALEGLHCETGPGVWEGAIAVDTALNAADKAVLFKTFGKSFFQKRDKIATFMAKWSMDYPGQSGHCHQSLFDLETGLGAFFDDKDPFGMSEIQKHYVAGLQKYLRPFLALTSPTINSYTRLVKGAWAPTASTWGIENRTTALRVIPGSSKSQRVEFRIGSADANPYLVAAATLGAGLLGIKEKLTLSDPVKGNAYEIQDELPESAQLPANLRDATRDLAGSAEARQVFGDEFIDHYVASRDWEVREYERNVNDWQLKRYFEII